MRIGIISDTHRNRTNLRDVAEWLISNKRITSLYHLGDDYEDVVELEDMPLNIVQVPGIYHQRYEDGTLESKVLESIYGVRIFLVHSYEKDISEDDKKVTDIILYGHTHRPEIKVEDGLLLMNPGHLKSGKDKKIEPSFGFLEIKNENVIAIIFNINFKEIKYEKLVRSDSGLYRT